jgi:hypothetical protein
VSFRGLIVGTALLGGCTNVTSAPVTSIGDTAQRSICPETIVIHTNENPSADVGFLYHMFTNDYSIDSLNNTITGPLDTSSSVLNRSRLQIRHGGETTNFEKASSILHSDSDVLLALIDTDEAIALADVFPTQALFSVFQKSSDIIYWDPNLYPRARQIVDHNSWDVRVMYAEGEYFMQHLLATQQLKTTQPVTTFDGTPIPFIASGGMFLQQGRSTVDPYAYRYIYRDWMKDIAYQYLHDAGWQPYALSVSAMPEQISRHTQCLEVLIPALQRAVKDFLASPQLALTRVIDATRQFNTVWSYSPEQAQAAIDVINKDELVADGPNNVLGSFDPQRMTDFLATFQQTFPDNYTLDNSSEQLFTNRFLDSTISLNN